MQLIVFFNRSTFNNLLRREGLNEDFKNLFWSYKKNEDGEQVEEFFNTRDLNAIIYIDENGKFEADSFEQKRASIASILMMPDNINIDYVPEDYFIILRHNSPVTILESLMDSTFYVDIKRDNEENKNQQNGEDSLYFKLVLFIGNSKQLTFNQFLKENNLHGNTKLNVALDFLHECLISKPKEVPTELSNSETKKLLGALSGNLQDEGYNDALAKLRDAILKEAGVIS